MKQRITMWWYRHRKYRQCRHTIGSETYSSYCSRDRRHVKWDPMHLAVFSKQAWFDDRSEPSGVQVDYPDFSEAARRLRADDGREPRFPV